MLDILQTMTAGKRIEYDGEEWILISNTLLKTEDGRALFVAIKAGATFPAEAFIIPGDASVHLSR